MITKSIRTESPFITEVLDSLRRRSKALKHQNAVPVIDRFIESRDGQTEQRVEITFTKRSRQKLILTLWDDRTVAVMVSQVVV